MGDQALLTVLGPTVSVLAGDLEDTSPVIVLKRRVVLCCELSNHAVALLGRCGIWVARIASLSHHYLPHVVQRECGGATA
jgi:hypothetical protein